MRTDELTRLLVSGLETLSPASAGSTRRLAVELGLHEGSRVLELGCGTGRTARQLASEIGCSVVATDNDPVMLEIAQARTLAANLADRVDVRYADIRSLFAFFPEERFDAVFSEDGAAHVGVANLAQQAHAVLKPEGTLAFSLRTWKTPLNGKVPEELTRVWEALHPAPIHRMDTNMNELADNGFRKGFAYELGPDAWQSYLQPLSEQLEALRGDSVSHPILEALAEEIRIVRSDNLEHLGCFVYGGDPDRAH